MIRSYYLSSVFLLALSGLVWAGEPEPVTLRVQSAKVVHAASDAMKHAGTYSGYYDGNAAVTLQMEMSLSEGMILPLGRDPLSIETFVDDTYQNLESATPNYGYNQNQATVLANGRSVLFTVSTSRAPADEATRVFVRGSLQARISRASSTYATGTLALVVGEHASLGPFRIAVHSIMDQGASGVQASLSVEGEIWRVDKLRLLDSSGRLLNDDKLQRQTQAVYGERPSIIPLTLKSLPKDPVTVECAYFEKVDSVRIPFEAQADLGYAKAGPIEASDGKVRKEQTTAEMRQWPPPQKSAEMLPGRRGPFTPAVKVLTNANQRMLTGEPAVDIFSLTVGKPGSNDAKLANWKFPPAPEFLASGFTVARLMLTAPGGCILSVPNRGVQISRFEDDKGNKLDPSMYQPVTYGERNSNFPLFRRSADGSQALLDIALASTLAPGTLRCHLAGAIRARIGQNETTNTATAELRTGHVFKVDPISLTLGAVQQSAPMTPGSADGREVTAWVSVKGPLQLIHGLEFLDSSGSVISSSSALSPEMLTEKSDDVSTTLRFSKAPSGPVTLRVRQFKRTAEINVPFDFKLGVGL